MKKTITISFLNANNEIEKEEISEEYARIERIENESILSENEFYRHFTNSIAFENGRKRLLNKNYSTCN